MRGNGVKLLGVGAAISSLAADQMTKSWAVRTVAADGDIHVGSFLDIVSVKNEGVAFGMATGAGSWILIAIGMVVTCVLAVWMARSTSTPQIVGLGLAIGGALGNIIDRIYLGSVRDFLDFHWGDAHWPAFNLADAFILTGLVLVIFLDRQGTPRRVASPH